MIQIPESEYESDQESTPGSNCDEDEPSRNLEPEFSAATIDSNDSDCNYSQSAMEAQLQDQHDVILLAQLHADIKARAQLPDPTYPNFHALGLPGPSMYESYLVM